MRGKATFSAPRRQLAQGHLLAQAESGLSVQAYCDKAGIGVSTFYYWKRRYGTPGRGSAVGAAAEPTFVELLHTPTATPTATWAYRVELAGGTVLQIGRGFRAEELRELIGIVRGAATC